MSPLHGLDPINASACWTQITLEGSKADTILSVYTGHSLPNLTLVASNDNCTALAQVATRSCVFFTTKAASLYYLQVSFGVERGLQGWAVRITTVLTPDMSSFGARSGTARRTHVLHWQLVRVCATVWPNRPTTDSIGSGGFERGKRGGEAGILAWSLA